MSKPIFWENSEKNVSECRLLHHENFDPLKPHCYSKTRVYRGIHYFSYLAKKNIYCGYSLEPPRRGGSNEYPQSMFWVEIWKISDFFFLSENFPFLVVKFSIYLNRRVFVMEWARRMVKVKERKQTNEPSDLSHCSDYYALFMINHSHFDKDFCATKILWCAT